MLVKCLQGAVTIYPQTGVTIPELNIEIPLVANPKGESYILEEGESYAMPIFGQPAVGGKFRAGNSAIEVTNDTTDPVTIVRWFDVDNDPIYLDEMQSYLDEDGNHTNDNMVKIVLDPGDSYETDIIRSNALTVSVLPILVTITT